MSQTEQLAYLTKCLVRKLIKSSELDHPVGDISPSAPVGAPCKNLLFHLLPGNTKYGGIWLPRAFPPAIIVTLKVFGDVTD